MRTKFFVAAGLSVLLLAACDNAGDEDVDRPIPPAEDSSAVEPEGDPGDRAQDALGEAGQAARETLENLGEAAGAGIEALQENAPEIRENLNQAGERLRNAADALTDDPATDDPDAPPLDSEGDSERDLNETPERQEPAAQ